MTRFSLTFLGTSAAIPTRERGLAATVVQHGGHTLLVDCGEGTQRQLRASRVGLVSVDAVLLTHLHGDHCLGLIGLLKSYDLLGRTKSLLVTGPAGLLAFIDLIAPLVGPVGFEVTTQELAPGEEVTGLGGRAAQGMGICGYATRHAVPSVGYRFHEPDRPGVFDPARAQALGLRPGPDYAALQARQPVRHGGRWISPEQVVGPTRPGRLVVLTGDTEPCHATVEAARGADLLVHEATFLADDRQRARQVQHTCADEAARIAAEAGVRSLALTHLSAKVSPVDVLAQARAVFADCFVPNDLDQVEVAYPSRDEPLSP
ncbi:MAG: ribonuclease Z [Actinomycetales bacterium]